MDWKRILVPHDFGGCAQKAEKLAIELALLHGATLLLVHVTELPHGLSPATMISPEGAGVPTSIELYVTDSIRAKLEEVAEPIRRVKIPVESHPVIGDTAPAIVDAAKRLGANLIVMGTHGRRGLSHLLLGSVAEKVLRLSPVPVLTVRSPESESDARHPQERAHDGERSG